MDSVLFTIYTNNIPDRQTTMITSMQRHEHSLLMVVRLLNKVENSMANGDSDPREQFLRLERCYQ